MTTSLPKIGKPATSALNNIGVTSLEAVSKYDRTTLLGIHGVGPKAIGILEDALKAKNMNFKGETDIEVPFQFTGDLSCNNAPKRESMLTFLIGSALIDEDKLHTVLSEDVVWEVAGAFKLEGFDALVQELTEHQTNIASIEVKANLSHGKSGAIHGTQVAENGSVVYFSDVIEFESHRKDAKIKYITSYVIMDEGES